MADRLEHTARWIGGLSDGIKYLKKVIIDNTLDIFAHLEKEMEKAGSNLFCEWVEALKSSGRQRCSKQVGNTEDQIENVEIIKGRDEQQPASCLRILPLRTFGASIGFPIRTTGATLISTVTKRDASQYCFFSCYKARRQMDIPEAPSVEFDSALGTDKWIVKEEESQNPSEKVHTGNRGGCWSSQAGNCIEWDRLVKGAFRCRNLSAIP